MSLGYRSFAKVNLHLQVVGKRSDGFHELRTVFQSVALHDVLRIAASGGGVRLAVSGADLTCGPENLVHRAATAFLSRWGGARGVDIELDKRIPAGGGLGGGSSNAATTLLALRDLCSAPESLADLRPLARELGADVPYFLTGGTALGVGRGDEILPLPELREADIWIAAPAVAVSTAEVFGALAPPIPQPLAGDVLALAHGPAGADLASLDLWNDLQDLVLRRFSAVERVYTSLLRGGFEGVRLSGSGACLIARWTGTDEPRLELPAGTRLLRTRMLNRTSLDSQRRIA